MITSGEPAPRTALRAGALALLMACTALVAGCSPPNRVNSAVYLRDGEPTVVIHLCSGKDRLTGLSLTERFQDATPSAPGPSESAGPQRIRAWHVGAGAPDGPRFGEIRLLDTPPGWTVHTSAENLLSELRDGQRYEVEVGYRGPSAGRDVGVVFTLGDLRSLAPGEVWGRPEAYDREVPMTLDAFRRMAKASC